MPTYLKPTINGNCGKHKFIWGGRDVECTPTQPSSPITRSTEHGEDALYMRSAPFPFPHVLWCTCQASTCNDMPGNTRTLFYIFRGEKCAIPTDFPNTWHSSCNIYKDIFTHNNSLPLYEYTSLMNMSK